MNEIYLTNIRPQDPILGPFSKVFSSINTLYRVTCLSKHLQNTSRHLQNAESEIFKIQSVWVEIQQQLQQLLENIHQTPDANIIDGMKEKLKCVLNDTNLQGALFDIYLNLVDVATDAQALDACACKFLNEVETVNTTDVLKARRNWIQVHEDLQKILKNPQEPTDASAIDEMKDEMKFILNTINHSTIVFEIYGNLVHTATNAKALDKCTRKFLDDLGMVNKFSITKTFLGLSGPTHIISYNRYSRHALQGKPRNYVVKWTNSNEICCSRLYETLAQYWIKKGSFSSFLVPKTASLDFENRTHDSANYTKYEQTQRQAVELKQSFYAIVGKGKSDTQIMLIEKIIGSDLLDFVQTKYVALDINQRKFLFEKIGELTLLDLVIGNPDRLGPHTIFNGNEYEFVTDSPANLGNLMIEWDSGPNLKVYAIDNSINNLLICNEEQKAAYKKFLKSICNPIKIDFLATLISASLKTGLKKATKYVDADAYQSFLNDLTNPEIAQVMLKNGLCTMLKILQQSLSLFWNSEESAKVKNLLSLKHDLLLQAISERFEIFIKQTALNRTDTK